MTLRAVLALAAILSPFGMSSAKADAIVYQNDFEGLPVAGSEWSNTSIDTSPTARSYLGWFVNERVTLDLAALPTHDSLVIAFDLYIMSSWDGDTGVPESWNFGVTGGPTILNTSFSNHPGWTQSYPDALGSGSYLAKTGAAEQNVTGYGGAFYGDAVYRIEATVQHSDSTVQFYFDGVDLQYFGPPPAGSFTDEAWGIDNISVTAVTAPVPEPGSIVLLGMALLGYGIYRRRRKAS